jgi:hypothetical protein
MAIKYIIVLFVETPRKFITAVINLRGVSTNKTIIIYEYFRHCPRSVYNAKSQIFTCSYNGCIPRHNKCNFKLGLAELFPTIKPMSSTSKTVLNSYD